ncbi:MAG: L,D-transpeptidase family protein [Siphonobacter aquaeclarae]|nr:L,D-transpeptidase family protein [Siphonobacter aquaeclarae]
MRAFLPLAFFLLPWFAAAQQPLRVLKTYAFSKGIDTVCHAGDSVCARRLITELLYGHAPDGIAYAGVKENLNVSLLTVLTDSVAAGRDWYRLLAAHEPEDLRYCYLEDYWARGCSDEYAMDAATLAALKIALNEYRWLNRFPGPLKIVVNIPSAQLEVRNAAGKVLLRSRVIAGKKSTPTPVFSAPVTQVITYPYWNVPASITRKELLPKLRNNPGLLNEMGMQVIDKNGRVVDPASIDWQKPFSYRLRQSTGCDNSLGVMKFQLKSPFDIYLHDTNNRAAFSGKNRFLSHGCVRVEKPVELANAVLGKQVFKPSFLTSCPANPVSGSYAVSPEVPVFFVYRTLDVTETGDLVFYEDIYEKAKEVSSHR